MVEVYIDGASLGNPGKIGIGYLIFRDNKLVKKEGVYLGMGTNNFSEYMAFIFSLIEVIKMGEKSCCVYSDSKLLCEQVKGNFKVKNPNIYPLYILVKKIISYFEKFDINHIDREKNKEADRLASEAIGFV
ncbi:MAG: ribonuclease HI family protein [Candidatus Omnitrophica bacterium]|nr:ribonuclease HI family protein [Candidatus Omnitrophota bacterium]MCM8826499.1 ribonuclease HI family protein [Candidatus Omnitrophota bacterium]